jgi:N-methylhydantoinase B
MTIQILDGVQLAVITNRFQGIVRNMANTLFRTGRSGVINTAHDFSCCIITQGGDFLIMADSLPIHVMRGPDIMARVMKEFHPDLRRGDAFLHNSPYHGNSHPGDLAVLVPVVDEQETHHFTALAKAHLADIGCALPTTYMAAARDVYEEGSLIFPAVQVQRDYEDIQDIIRMCKLRIRAPEVWWGDYLALLGAARIAERRILELGAELGWDTLHEYTRQWFNYSERMMDAAIRKMPSGKVTVTAHHDPFPGVPQGIPVKVTVEVRSEEGMIEVDLRDNWDNQPCGLNQSEATARTHAQIGVFNSIPHTVPTNAGSFRRINVLLRENCVVGIPRHPASCSVATTSLGNRIGNAVMRAMAELGEGIGMGEVGAIMPPSFAVISGRDPRAGNAPFVNQLLLGAAGGSGGPSADGWLTIGDEGAMGMVHLDSVESDEFLYPITVTRRHIIPDSEGAGRFRGAPGMYVEFKPVDCAIEAMYASDGTVYPAEGARSGGSGGRAAQYKRTASGELLPLGPMGPVALAPDETIVSIGAGGGGYGPPYEREIWRVKKDREEGWISRERAEAVYGVVFSADGQVDEPATSALRARLAGQ